MNQALMVNGRSFDKVHLILNADHNAGFCALITYALNGIRIALANNRLPVVNFDEKNCPYFFEAMYGDNVWEYYFEPVHGMSYAELAERLASGALDPDLIHTDDPGDVLYWHQHDPERLATFWAYDVPEDPREWIAIKRALGRRYVAEYIKLKPRISRKVDAFYEQCIKGTYTFGAHVRGTDFAYAEPTPPEEYFKAIDELSRNKGLNDFRVFLATDQNQFVSRFRREYGDRLVTYDAMRSTGEVAAFRFSDVSNYKKGEDVLIDLLMLSRSDHVLKCAAAGGECALWFNPELDCTDFSLQSSFDTRDYHVLESAYLKLNVDGISPWTLKARRVYGVYLEYVRSRGITRLARRAWQFVLRLIGRAVQ